MKKTVFERNNSDYFKSKKATVLVDQSNIGEELIKTGEIVSIIGKDKSGLGIKSNSGVIITGVSYEYLDLI